MIILSDTWKAAFPDAHVGFLALDEVSNPAHHQELDGLKRDLESDLRTRLGGLDRKALEALSVLPAYAAYYKSFKKTYHVQAQLESVVLKGRSLPGVAALVEAMFMAELKNLVLTAGHDLERLDTPVTVSVATGAETYTTLRGQEQALKPGDMFMADRSGVISSILYGPDQRTQITPATTSVLFAAYAPQGVGAAVVDHHLGDIVSLVRMIAPMMTVRRLSVLGGAD